MACQFTQLFFSMVQQHQTFLFWQAINCQLKSFFGRMVKRYPSVLLMKYDRSLNEFYHSILFMLQYIGKSGLNEVPKSSTTIWNFQRNLGAEMKTRKLLSLSSLETMLFCSILVLVIIAKCLPQLHLTIILLIKINTIPVRAAYNYRR